MSKKEEAEGCQEIVSVSAFHDHMYDVKEVGNELLVPGRGGAFPGAPPLPEQGLHVRPRLRRQLHPGERLPTVHAAPVGQAVRGLQRDRAGLRTDRLGQDTFHGDIIQVKSSQYGFMTILLKAF